jgi:hypothetical protein
MAYSAIEKMRKKNEQIYGRDVGPMQPALSDGAATGSDLKSAALRFLHERCEGLLFDRQIEEEEDRTGLYRGVSLGPDQIPYNMQMDINRLCLERELEKFMDSAATQDAYTVFYCFLEIFFGNYGQYKKQVEMLSEYESNGSSLLMKHRDHYSHSVFVFALGLAIYETNAHFRRAFNSYYHFDQTEDGKQASSEAAHFFLEYWGITSLFHDIGYPFELTFEQVMAFFEAGDDDRTANNPFVVYKNMKTMTELSPRAQERFERLYGRKFRTIDELLAFDLTRKLGPFYGFSEEYLRKTLKRKPVRPESFCGYMDHAYFSSLLLYHMLEAAMETGVKEGSRKRPQVFGPAHVDALGAILLHYDLYTYSIASSEDGTKPKLSMDMHPLAWLLLLCDELQCWDRTAYGRNSRKELHPMAVEFDFSKDRILARYLYDEKEQDKIDTYLWAYVKWKQNGKRGSRPKLKAYSEMANEEKSFVRNIEQIVDTSTVPITVVCDTAPVNRGNKHIYLSSSSFLHIHDFAAALNARYAPIGDEDDVDRSVMEKDFSVLSLEYKLSSINQVKSFGRYLHEIHCFYTDRQVDFDMLEAFTPEQILRFAPLEHERWLREHRSMGWRNGDLYERVPAPPGADEKTFRAALREQTRCHRLVMDGELTKERIIAHYQEHLSEYEKQKNYQPFNRMLKLMRKFDGVRIYQYYT